MEATNHLGIYCGSHLCEGAQRRLLQRVPLLINIKIMRGDYMMNNNEKLTIKQMMAIPKGYEVMTKIQQEDGRDEFEATRDSLFPY